LKAEVFPKLAEWGLLLWGVLKKLVGFFETTIWPFIEKTLWPVIEKIGDRLATLLVKVIDKIIEHWPVIEAYILGAIDAWVASIEQQVDAFIEVADTAGALSEALDPYDLGIYDLKQHLEISVLAWKLCSMLRKMFLLSKTCSLL